LDTSSPGCGGSGRRSWSRRISSPGRCRSGCWGYPPSWRSSRARLRRGALALVARRARIVALAVGLGIAEWLRGHLFTGFPWNALGMALGQNIWLMQGAALLGLTASPVSRC
jgi:hypothetical protein